MLRRMMGLAAMSALVWGCATPYSVVVMKPTTPKFDDTTQCVFDNDTVRIVYNFWGSGGVFAFSVFNKLPVPIFIDWKHSTFITGGTTHPYWSDRVYTDSKGIAASDKYGTSVAGKSVTEKKERMTIIPSGAKVSRTVPGNIVSPEPRYSLQDRWQAASATTLRNYLGFTLGETDLEHEFFVDNAFIPGSIIPIRPGAISRYKRPDRFYLPAEISAHE